MDKRLDVWVIKAGEVLPLDDNTRSMRTGMLAQALAARGHQVTYWASTFSHFGKKHLFPGQMELSIGSPEYTLALLHGPPYAKNVSFERLVNHWREARDFVDRARSKPRPDVIVCCLPTIDLCDAAIRFGQENDVPVLIDVRDKWPEIFILRVPRPLQPAFRVLLSPLYTKVERIFRKAAGISGVSHGFVDWAASLAGRSPAATDAVFPSAYNPPRINAESMKRADAFWAARGVGDFSKQKIVVYVGSLSRRASGELLRFARLFSNHDELCRDWRLIICGDGELAGELRKYESGGMDLPGWLGHAEIHALLERASLGIIPYPNEPDLLAACPNKFAEYLSAGVPILSHLGGEVARFLGEARCGWVYRSDEEVLQAMAEITADPVSQAARRERARALYERQFQADSVYCAFARHVEQTALAKPSPETGKRLSGANGES